MCIDRADNRATRQNERDAPSADLDTGPICGWLGQAHQRALMVRELVQCDLHVVEATGPSMADIEAKLERHAAKDSPLGQSLTALMRADPGFDPGQFLDGAKAAYEMIVTSFAGGDRKEREQRGTRHQSRVMIGQPCISA